MFSAFNSHNSAQVTYKKSLPKSSSIPNHHNFKVYFTLCQGGGSNPTTSRPKISSTKYLNESNLIN